MGLMEGASCARMEEGVALSELAFGTCEKYRTLENSWYAKHGISPE